MNSEFPLSKKGVIDHSSEKSGNGIRVPFGLSSLGAMETKMNGGLVGGRLYVLGGIPSAGKTGHTNNIADNICLADHPVLFFSYDDGVAELRYRTFSRFTGFGIEDFNQRKVSKNDMQAIFKTDQIKKIIANKYVVQEIIKIEQWPKMIEKIKARHQKAPVIVIDYLRKLKTENKNSDERLRVDEILSNLTNLAKTHNTPIFLDLENVITKENELSTKPVDFKSEDTVKSKSDKSIDSNSLYSLSFDDSYFRRCTGLKLSSIDIKNLLLETARVEFKLTFPVRLKDSGNKEVLHKMNFYSRFFELAVENEKSRKDGIIQHRRYRVFFTTILGQLFINNLKAKFNSRLDIKFYTLPESAQIFYRRALLHNSFNRTEMNRETVANIIGLKDQNYTNLTKTIETNVLEPLKRGGFIDSYSKTDGMKDVKFIINRKKSTAEISE